jgi:hypothetical protein
MIPNLINTVIGIWLVYAAVLNPTELGGRLEVFGAGVAAFAVAVWAYLADYIKWPATTAGALGAALALYSGFPTSEPSGFLTFWIALFVGIAVAIVSLWSALYRQPSAPEFASRATSPRGAAHPEPVSDGADE